MRRKCFKLTAEVVERLRKYFIDNSEVHYAAILGSTVSRGMSHHDVDLAIKILPGRGNKYDILLKILDNISRILDVDSDFIDLIDLDRADAEVKRRVILDGITLIDRGYLRNLIKELMKIYPEYSEFSSLSISEWLRSEDPSSIDLQVIKRRIDFAKNEAEFLEEQVLSRTLQEVESSPVLKRLLERGFQLIVEALIDICRHIVAIKGWGPAFTAIDFVRECVKHGVLSQAIGDEVVKTMKLRNIIVHRYLDIDYKELYREAKKLLMSLRGFEKDLVNFLMKKA